MSDIRQYDYRFPLVVIATAAAFFVCQYFGFFFGLFSVCIDGVCHTVRLK